MIIATIQTSVVFLVVWLTFRLVPSIPANTRSWIWRLAFLKPIVALLPFAAVTLHILPAKSNQVIVQASDSKLNNANLAIVSGQSLASHTATIDLWTGLWVAGSAAFLIMGAMSATRIERLARNAKRIENPTTQSIAAELLQIADIKSPVSILHSDEVTTPLLIGFRRPTILIPSAALTDDAKGDLRLMLAHEIAHLARRDSGWFIYFWVVQALLFFNPVVWFATRCARLDHESATDEYASQLADVPVQTYAEMLLRATVVTRGHLAPGTAPMSESYRSIHRRLEAMKHFKTPSTPMRKTATIALAFAVVGLLPLYQFANASPDGTQDVKPGSPVAVRSVDQAPVKVVQGRPASLVAPSAQPRPGDAAPIVVPGHPMAPRSADSRPAVAPVPAKPQRDKVLGRAADIQKVGQPAPAAKPSKRGDAVLTEGQAIAPRAVDIVKTDLAPAPVPAPADVAPIALQSKDRVLPVRPSDAIGGSDRRYDIVNLVAAEPVPAKESSRKNEAQTFTLEMNGAQIEDVVRLLCKSAKKEYIIDSQVKGPVNVILKEVTFDVAIEALANSVQATYKIENGVYHIVPK